MRFQIKVQTVGYCLKDATEKTHYVLQLSNGQLIVIPHSFNSVNLQQNELQCIV